jgi:hypothetical protein
MPRYTCQEFPPQGQSDAIQSSNINLVTDGWKHATITINPKTASAGTVTVKNTPPEWTAGATATQTFGDDAVYTVGTSTGPIVLLYADIGTLHLVVSGVNAAMSYRVCCYND